MIAIIDNNLFQPIKVDTNHDIPFAKRGENETFYYHPEGGTYLVKERSGIPIPDVLSIPIDIIAIELCGAVILDENTLDRLLDLANADE